MEPEQPKSGDPLQPKAKGDTAGQLSPATDGFVKVREIEGVPLNCWRPVRIAVLIAHDVKALLEELGQVDSTVDYVMEDATSNASRFLARTAEGGCVFSFGRERRPCYSHVDIYDSTPDEVPLIAVLLSFKPNH